MRVQTTHPKTLVQRDLAVSACIQKLHEWVLLMASHEVFHLLLAQRVGLVKWRVHGGGFVDVKPQRNAVLFLIRLGAMGPCALDICDAVVVAFPALDFPGKDAPKMANDPRTSDRTRSFVGHIGAGTSGNIPRTHDIIVLDCCRFRNRPRRVGFSIDDNCTLALGSRQQFGAGPTMMGTVVLPVFLGQALTL